MSRKTAIIVLVSVMAVIGLSIGISKIPYTYIDPDSMPSCSIIYLDQDNIEKQTRLFLSGYRWRVKDPETGVKNWETAGPNNFFAEKYALKEVTPGAVELHLQIIWNEPPDYVVIRRWPQPEWTPGDYNATHSEGMDVVGNWESSWKKTDIGFDIERGSLYGIWAYYGDAWVEYSFMIPAEDPNTYDCLGYFSGFDDSNADQFTLDPVEWISLSDTERIEELNLNPDDDMPSGFYIYNPAKEAVLLRFTDQTKYIIINPDTGNTSKTVDKSEFLNYLNQSQSFGETTLFWISETDGNVEFIKEQYVP